MSEQKSRQSQSGSQGASQGGSSKGSGRSGSQQQQSGRTQSREQQGQERQQSRGPLQTERGATTIQDTVVARISGIAAQEVEGVRMGGGGAQAVSGVLGSITGGRGPGGQTQGVSVEVGAEQAAVDFTATIEYGRSIPQISEAVRRNIINRVESLVGLSVTEVNIDVADVHFPREAEEEQTQLEQGQQQGRVE